MDAALATQPLDESELAQLAADMARACRRGDCLALSGDLGAGKSSFARAFIRALAQDWAGALDVPSPTFTLVQTYATEPPVAHFDLYRVASPEEVHELGLEDALEAGIALLEWPERAGSALPGDAITLSFVETDDDKRLVTISGAEQALSRIGRSLAVRVLLEEVGHGQAFRAPLTGDASTRAYETVTDGDWNAIVMDAPPMPDGPPVRDSKPYSQIAHLAEDIRPFVAIGQMLSKAHFSAPAMMAIDFERGLIVLDNLGDGAIITEDRQPIADRYEAAIDCLVAMHGQDWPRAVALEDGSTHAVPGFDLGAFLIETELLARWFVPRATGSALTHKDCAAYSAIWTDLFAVIDADEKTLLLRDFHSPNIIWRGDRTGHDRIGLIDFQDALWGHPAYDVMSLAKDARVDVPDALQHHLLDRYCTLRVAATAGFDEGRFRAAAAILAAQRAAKILGIFVRLDERDGKPGYIAHLPRIQGYLRGALTHPVLAELKAWIDARGLLDVRVAPR